MQENQHIETVDSPPGTSGSADLYFKHGVGRREVLMFSSSVFVFTGIALLLGLPGADTNATDTYNVISRLAEYFTYRLFSNARPAVS